MPRVEEIPITGPSAVRVTPGWALIPDSSYIDPSKAPLNPTSSSRNKRASRLDAGPVSADALTRKQEKARLHRLDVLNAENKFERGNVVIELPKKSGKEGKKMTSSVRKILSSGRTFAMHLDDEEALLRQQADAGGPSTYLNLPKVEPMWAIPQPKKRKQIEPPEGDAMDVDAPEPALNGNKHDEDLLLETEELPLPTKEELLKLIMHPPLSYNAARAGPPPPDRPQRHFCEICGYWGTVKCPRCGSRTCGLQHKTEHDISCLG